MPADNSVWAVTLIDPDVRADPFAAYEAMRRHGGIGWNRRLGAWMVSGYDQVRRVLSEHETFSSRIRQAEERSLFGASTMIFTDPAESTRLRQILSAAFTAAAVRRLEPAVRSIATELVDAAVRRGEFDLMRDLAGPLPVMVIAELLGIPAADRPFLKETSDAVVSIGLAGGSTAKARHEAGRRLRDYFRRGLVDGGLDGDLIRLLRTAYPAPIEAEVEEMVAAAMLVLVAGHETTTNLIGNAILYLLERPSLWDWLAGAPEFIPSATEELIRLAGSVHILRRVTTRVANIDGCTMPTDQPVLALICAANRDPQRFGRPSELLIDHRGQAPHLAFGWGSHYCLGAHLARLETRVVLATLIARSRPALGVSPAEIAYIPSLFVRGPLALPLVLT